MALTNAEVQKIRVELGYPNYNNAAAAYVGTEALFEQVIQPYLLGSASTTSSTPVTAATEPTPQTLTLTSATGFAAGDVVIVDVDARQERATISNLSGAAATVQLSLAHSGTFPVVLEGAESSIRDILTQLRLISGGMNGNKSELSKMMTHLGIKKVEGEIEWFGGGGTLASQGLDPLTLLTKMRDNFRDELASILNIPRLNGRNNSGGSSISVY